MKGHQHGQVLQVQNHLATVSDLRKQQEAARTYHVWVLPVPFLGLKTHTLFPTTNLIPFFFSHSPIR